VNRLLRMCAGIRGAGLMIALFLALGAETALCQSQGAGQAAGYPSRTVRLLVGYSPGGFPDTVARILAHKLGERWGQQVIVDNRPGANGIVAADLVAKAAADGYTLLVTDSATTAINPALHETLPYNAEKDFVPVALAARAPLFLAVNASVPANSFAEFVALVKARPGRLNYGSSGIGSVHHLCMESVKSALGLDMVHVPYKGTGQSVPAVAGGEVSAVFSAYSSLSGFASSNRVKLLAVNSARRSKLAPGIPTIAEIAIPGFDCAPTMGILAPAGTPADVVAKIGAEVIRTAQLAEVVREALGMGIEMTGESQKDYAELLKADAVSFAKAVKAAGARLQ
jgi:tripartite-type tricarboxylate transporter receptor subunit TctC